MDSPNDIYAQLLLVYSELVNQDADHASIVCNANYCVGYHHRLNKRSKEDVYKLSGNPKMYLLGWNDADGDLAIWERIWEE